MSSWHREDWAKIGTSLTDWITAHPMASAVILTAFVFFILGAIIF